MTRSERPDPPPTAEVTDLPAVEPVLRGAPPIAILVDYDGTIALTDVSDTVLAEYVTGEWEELAAAYDAGLLGSRRLMQQELELLRADESDLLEVAARQPHDPGFVAFARQALDAGIVVEIVSDGFGFFIPPALERLGLSQLPVVTAATRFVGRRATIEFPNGHPRCFVCGTCKRNRVLAHQAAGRAVVFVGDGSSDRYAAAHADVVFAKDALVTICLENRWPFRRWTEFVEIARWLQGVLERWRVEPATLPGPQRRPFSCGPEVWGPGHWDPPRPGAEVTAGDLDEGIAPG